MSCIKIKVFKNWGEELGCFLCKSVMHPLTFQWGWVDGENIKRGFIIQRLNTWICCLSTFRLFTRLQIKQLPLFCHWIAIHSSPRLRHFSHIQGKNDMAKTVKQEKRNSMTNSFRNFFQRFSSKQYKYNSTPSCYLSQLRGLHL